MSFFLDQASTDFNPMAHYNSEWFLNVLKIDTPKSLTSLESLWSEMSVKQVSSWLNHQGVKDADVATDQIKRLLNAKTSEQMDQILEEMDDVSAYCAVRIIHIRIHLCDLDKMAASTHKPTKHLRGRSMDLSAVDNTGGVLDTKLIIQSFLDYLSYTHNNTTNSNLPDTMAKFRELLSNINLRLVSTVHPNETERSTNLQHYDYILEKYIEWKRLNESLTGMPSQASEYRTRREKLNQLRRDIKAEIEGVFQSDQMRPNPISVESEGRRLMQRYSVIFNVVPFQQKFIKHLAKEAYYLFIASVLSDKPEFVSKFSELYEHTKHTRTDRLHTIKKTLDSLNIATVVPRVDMPIIKFGTWKGGDRDGNPFVVASFSNQTFIEQKLFVLEHYLNIVTQLVDKITPSTTQIEVSDDLLESIRSDRALFPYIENVKGVEPYRAKLRYMQEKLQNTVQRCTEVLKKAGETTRPLMSSTLLGPTGYNDSKSLQDDIEVIYRSLIKNGGKSQARSNLQDLKILVSTFGIHMCSIDFRQTSEKNREAMLEYLQITQHESVQNVNYSKLPESEKREILLKVLTDPKLEFNPWLIPQMSKITKDTFQSLLVFSDASATDSNSVGKFIISMCQNVSDILTTMVLMRLTKLLFIDSLGNIKSNHDVTGLFETIGDLVNAPIIVNDLLNIKLIRHHILQERDARFTVMLGYSDSVRDGSSLASDAFVARTGLELKRVKDSINKQHDTNINLVYYRGRGDTLPRGFGGNIKKAILSQSITTLGEDHTEQNRYLRRYSSESSALDHLWNIFSAHVSAVVRELHPDWEVFQRHFEFFGRLSNIAWQDLVRGEKGDAYFSILDKFSILPVLPKCRFASRPVCREGVKYDIDNIRAIPFSMDLAQMREFTSAYYGTGTAFEVGIQLLNNVSATYKILQSIAKEHGAEQALSTFESNQKLTKQTDSTHDKQIEDGLKALIERFDSVELGLKSVAQLLVDSEKYPSAIELLQTMFTNYAPFRYSIENKEMALGVRSKEIVDEYTREANELQRKVLKGTQDEADLTTKWLTKIQNKSTLDKSGPGGRLYNTPELRLLHKLQGRFLNNFTKQSEKGEVARKRAEELSIYVQMTILAVSEGLGFGG
ncbi:hypothetical protein AKO1_007897 [Acrasis kona]|uniref:Phosphoenolpyruvate carboxylase n=1 Tax=Acrasis kona TaxID=1008807 RepID=A0AAW2YQ52_9EUKA